MGKHAVPLVVLVFMIAFLLELKWANQLNQRKSIDEINNPAFFKGGTDEQIKEMGIPQTGGAKR